MGDSERKINYGRSIIERAESLLGVRTPDEDMEHMKWFDISGPRAIRFLSVLSRSGSEKFRVYPEDQIMLWVMRKNQLPKPEYRVTFLASRAPKNPLLVPLCSLSLDGTEPQKLHLYEYVSSDSLEEGTEGSPFKEIQAEPTFLVLGAVNKLLREPNRPEIIFSYTSAN